MASPFARACGAATGTRRCRRPIGSRSAGCRARSCWSASTTRAGRAIRSRSTSAADRCRTPAWSRARVRRCASWVPTWPPAPRASPSWTCAVCASGAATASSWRSTSCGSCRATTPSRCSARAGPPRARNSTWAKPPTLRSCCADPARRMLIALLLAFALHPDSVSSTRIVVRGQGVQLWMRSEELTFLQVLPLDRDGDGTLDAAELRAGAWTLADYVASRYRVAPLEPRFVDVRALASGSGILAGKRVLELEFAAELPAGCAGLTVSSSLFRESSPLHRDQCEIVWNDEAPATKLL